MPADSRRGFTLVELLAGLSLAGVVLASAIMLLDQLRDGRDRLLRAGHVANTAANGMRTLQAIVRRAEAGSSIETPFAGSETAAHFATWCDMPGGWLERCVAVLSVEREGDSSTVRATLSTSEVIDLVRAGNAIRFAYFDATQEGGSWASSWASGTSLPAAIGIRVGDELVVIRAGGR